MIGGAYFGDNLSMISDTTISAAQGCGSEMKDKFRMNFFIAAPAALAAILVYGFMGGQGNGAIEAGAYNLFQILPYIVVLGAAPVSYTHLFDRTVGIVKIVKYGLRTIFHIFPDRS